MVSNQNKITIGVMITTKNRAADLNNTLIKLNQLTPAPDELLITADGCTDNTLQVIKNHAPRAIIIINETGLGSVASRDHMLKISKSDLVLSLDDDSYPEQIDVLAQLVLLFDRMPGLAVAHFPQRTDEYPETLAHKDFGKPKLTGSYANSGACYRKSCFVEIGGFQSIYFHSYEEPDYALRCVSSGYDVLYWPYLIIRHHYSPTGRQEINTHQRHARNELWSSLMLCPIPLVLFMIPYRVFSQARYAYTRGWGWLRREPEWWFAALRGSRNALRKRRPVAIKVYFQWLWINRHPKELDNDSYSRCYEKIS